MIYVTFTPRRAPETAPGPGVNLDAGQGVAPRPATVQYAGPDHPAAATAVPGPVTAHSFKSSPPRAAGSQSSPGATETGGDGGGWRNTRRAPGPPHDAPNLQEPARAGRANLNTEGSR